MRAFFYDTWAFLALANTRDRDHATAAGLDEWLQRRTYAAVTSDYVLDETVTGLQAAAGARVALAFLDAVQERADGRDLLVVEVTRSRRDRATAVFRRLAPEEARISFTDCASFAVMQELGVELAFTADRHFHRAGKQIRPLLRRTADGLVVDHPEAP